jgi:hypothetical protein
MWCTECESVSLSLNRVRCWTWLLKMRCTVAAQKSLWFKVAARFCRRIDGYYYHWVKKLDTDTSSFYRAPMWPSLAPTPVYFTLPINIHYTWSMWSQIYNKYHSLPMPSSLSALFCVEVDSECERVSMVHELYGT